MIGTNVMFSLFTHMAMTIGLLFAPAVLEQTSLDCLKEGQVLMGV